MSLTDAEKNRLKKVGLSGLNKPKRTPSAAYWANKLFWSGKGGSSKSPPKSQKQKFGKS